MTLDHGPMRPERDTSPSIVAEGVRLHAPRYQELQQMLRRKIVSNFWNDGGIDPRRAAFRPSMESLRGEGATMNMPLAASWMSSGPSTPPEESNIIAFPHRVDRSFTEYMERAGVLGRHVFMEFGDFPKLAEEYGRAVYNVDDLPEEWDYFSANTSRTMRMVNTKKYLHDLSRFAAPDEIVDLRRTTVEDFVKYGGGRIYIKKNNTENTGSGVLVCDSADQYEQIIRELWEEATLHNLDFEIVLQPRIEGENSSFQYFMTPERPDDISILTISRQFVEEDGKTYAGNENPPMSLERIEPEVAALMADMHRRIQRIDPQAFGFVMCDYFRTLQGPLAFDPGLRPTGNTATVLARMFVEEQTEQRGEDGYYSESFFVPSRKPLMAFAEYVRRIDRILGIDSAVREGNAVLPWGYNQYQGNGVFIAVARVRSDLARIIEDTRAMLVSS